MTTLKLEWRKTWSGPDAQYSAVTPDGWKVWIQRQYRRVGDPGRRSYHVWYATTIYRPDSTHYNLRRYYTLAEARAKAQEEIVPAE
jgi:hypothetical protein